MGRLVVSLNNNQAHAETISLFSIVTAKSFLKILQFLHTNVFCPLRHSVQKCPYKDILIDALGLNVEAFNRTLRESREFFEMMDLSVLLYLLTIV